ncbi:unnamed protein product, partial [Ectocarpus sp. 6 AP-2014]
VLSCVCICQLVKISQRIQVYSIVTSCWLETASARPQHKYPKGKRAQKNSLGVYARPTRHLERNTNSVVYDSLSSFLGWVKEIQPRDIAKRGVVSYCGTLKTVRADPAQNSPLTLEPRKSRTLFRSTNTSTASHCRELESYHSANAQRPHNKQTSRTTKNPALCPTASRAIHHNT